MIQQTREEVFPSFVGVFPDHQGGIFERSSLPHVRGGVSIRLRLRKISGKSSPRSWGCFSFICEKFDCVKVFPTFVGVFLSTHTVDSSNVSLPHVRGGVSHSSIASLMNGWSSPRSWGCCSAFFIEKMKFGGGVLIEGLA